MQLAEQHSPPCPRTSSAARQRFRPGHWVTMSSLQSVGKRGRGYRRPSVRSPTTPGMAGGQSGNVACMPASAGHRREQAHSAAPCRTLPLPSPSHRFIMPSALSVSRKEKDLSAAKLSRTTPSHSCTSA